jgi:hypothetical protein
MADMRRWWLAIALVGATATGSGQASTTGSGLGQTPIPPSTARPAPPPPAAPGPASGEQPPSEATLGVPVYPGAQFLTSYDAGRGQRYYLFGSKASFAELVAYYRTILKTKGALVFEQPATHMFEIGRFREELMAFPPGVTVKDYTWGGSAGYPNPSRGADPERFPSVIMIVPAPPGTPVR